MRSTDREAAQRSIRTRHPGVRDFSVDLRRGRDWSIKINALDFGRSNIAAVETHACSLSQSRDGYLRLYLPFSEGVQLVVGGARRPLAVGRAAFGPLRDYSCSFGDDYRGVFLAIPQRAVADAIADLGGSGDLAASVERVIEANHASEGLTRSLLNLIRTLDESPARLLSQKRFLLAHEELLILQIAGILSGDEDQPSVQGSSSVYLARAFDFMRQHMFEEIGPTAVARAAGCSLRNLQLIFQREFNQTITGSLRQLRLQAAHARLMNPLDNDTITTVATDCGFSHLSDFARHYRSVFGELPSVTQGRVRGISLT